MPAGVTPFEAPAAGALAMPEPPHGRAAEPTLAVDQIQGNIVPGFLKDHQTLLFLRIDDPAAFARWLAALVPLIATTQDVLAFNRLFKSLRHRQGGEAGTVQSTWLNVAFSFAGLKKLGTAAMKLDEFADAAFKAGLLAQAGGLGDPVGSGTPGDPAHWVVGGPGREADVVIIGAADRRDDLNEAIARLATTLFPKLDASGKMVASGASVLLRQDGDTLNGPLSGHEHFGFRDGISQPGVRGRLPDGTPLTPSQNPLDADQSKPGQDLVWPGEFVFGYPGQDPDQDVAKPGPDPLVNPARRAPEFARNGSFLVFRRLRQDVGKFHRFLRTLGARFGVNPELVGARMVGRWPSGAPTVASPAVDDPALAADECRNNNFEFQAPGGVPTPANPAELDGEACKAPTAPVDDPSGARAPFASHIRKTYPRNDTSGAIAGLNERSTQTRRLLRRGIPYGEQSGSTPLSPVDDATDRGLLFLAYQTSIVGQFEFVTRAWANNPSFKEGGTGFDPIIGQNGADPSRRRSFRLDLPGETVPIETDQDWVIPTGGGYFFAPSIASLAALAARAPAANAGLAPVKKAAPAAKKAAAKKAAPKRAAAKRAAPKKARKAAAPKKTKKSK